MEIAEKLIPIQGIESVTLDQYGVFHLLGARVYIVHLAKGTQFLLHGSKLADQLVSENIIKDGDGSYWIALYHRCVHLGCIVPFRDECISFKCPCHGSHYNVDGEWLGKPAPRSMDRFAFSFDGEDLIVSDPTGKPGHVTSMPNAEQLPVSSEAGAVSWE